MTDPTIIRQPTLAYLTQPEPGVVYLNFKFAEPGITRGQGPFERIQLTHNQLCNMLLDGLPMALGSGLAADAVVMALGWRNAEGRQSADEIGVGG